MVRNPSGYISKTGEEGIKSLTGSFQSYWNAESARIPQYDKFQDDEQRGRINSTNFGDLISSGHGVIFWGSNERRIPRNKKVIATDLQTHKLS
jgi:hypothetical protein